MRFARLRSWIRSTARRNDLERAMNEEMELHLELYEADLLRAGVSPADARRRARLEFGSAAARQDECREALGLRVADELRADIIYALRLLRRSPGFTFVALMSLGLGIGANTAIFSLVDTVLVKSLPVANPERLFFLDNSGGKSAGSSGPPYPCYELWRDNNRYLSGIAAFDEDRRKVTIDGSPELMTVQYASGSYFDVLGVGAVHGRVLTRRDDAVPGGGPNGAVAVISHGLWTRHFGRDPGVLGKTIEVGTQQVTIVGVTPPEFFGLQVGSSIDVTVPMALAGQNLARRQLWWLSVIGRLKDGATVEQARADLERLWDGYMNDIGQPRERRTYFSGVALVPAARGLNGLRERFSVPLRIAMAIVAVVLLIGCANLANLLLARASARRDEIAVRLAIGATRARVTRQLFTEGAVLVLLGTLVGLALGRWGVSFLANVLASGARVVLDPTFDVRLFAFTMCVAIVIGLLFSIAPALRARRVEATRPGAARVSAARTRVRLGQSLVVLQIALSVALLGAAGLFLRTLHNLQTVDAGFDHDNVLVMQVEATLPSIDPARNARISADDGRLGAMWTRFVSGVNALPGISASAVATISPLTGRDRGVLAALVGGPEIARDLRYIHINQVTADYFVAMGIDLVAGRRFTTAERAGSPRVAILNESAARAYFGAGSSALGRHVNFPGQLVEAAYEVIGVVGDTRYANLRTPDERMAYLPLEQSIEPIGNAMLVVRGRTTDPSAFVPSIRKTASELLPSGFISRVATLEQQVEASLLAERLLSMLATLFGGLALVLACIGLYGVMAQRVGSRAREIAIRIAIGARQGSVIWMVISGTLALLAIGVVIGAGAAIAAGRYIRGVLFEVSPADPLAMIGAVAVLGAVALAASYVPVRRATRIEPAVALRAE